MHLAATQQQQNWRRVMFHPSILSITPIVASHTTNCFCFSKSATYPSLDQTRTSHLVLLSMISTPTTFPPMFSQILLRTGSIARKAQYDPYPLLCAIQSTSSSARNVHQTF